MIFDALILGGGVSGMQCALLLGSAKNKPFAQNKNIGIVMHQRASHLESALFNNVLGLEPNTLGKDILKLGKNQLTNLYLEVTQIENEKVISISNDHDLYLIKTTKRTLQASIVVIALNYAKPFTIEGLDTYLIPHQKSSIEKDRIQLKNNNYLIKKGLYCCGTIAGLPSQFAIASGSGAYVALEILRLWNDGNPVKIHDKI